MANIWIGDFRSRCIKQYQETAQNKSDKKITGTANSTNAANKNTSTEDLDTYLLEDSGECSWFESGLLEQLPLASIANANIIIMLGFNDCVYSCAFKSFSLDKIIQRYATAIDKLLKDYQTNKIYICSVPPVDGDYPFATCTDGIITSTALNAKIDIFNAELKTQVLYKDIKNANKDDKTVANSKSKAETKDTNTAIFIDTNRYLKSTSFYTHDGIRFDENTAKSIVDFISINTAQVAGKFSKERDNAPTKPDEETDGYYWLGENMPNGLNPYCNISGHDKSLCAYEGDTLPNCTAYAWGRFYELSGTRPTLCSSDITNNAEMWYLYDGAHDEVGRKNDGYSRGTEPAVGAIMCFSYKEASNEADDGAGHVAIVESINDDGSITISESGWNCSWYWLKRKLYKKVLIDKDISTWYYGPDYKFQGFIYCPGITSGNVLEAVPKNSVNPQCKTDGSYDTKKMETNARYIWNFFGTRGWTLNAVAAMIGNMEHESHISPNTLEYEPGTAVPRPEGNPTAEENEAYAYAYLEKVGRFPGYGLVQWTGQRSRDDDIQHNWSDQRFIYWCNTNKLDPTDIDSQLTRIMWELENGGAWYTGRPGANRYPELNMTFKDFSTSTQPAGFLAKAFLLNYEYPGNWENSLSIRATDGEKWYKYLSAYAPTAVVGATFSINNLKIDKVNTTNVKFSVLVNCSKSGKFTITEEATDKIVIKKSIEEDKFELTDNATGKAVVVSYEGLIPNKAYKLEVEIEGNSSGDKATVECSFTTPQAYPESVKNIELLAKNSQIPNDNFELDINTSGLDWGYWKTHGNAHGYTIQLLVHSVNSVIKKEKDITSLPTTIKISDYFGYTLKTGDTIQIGIRTWVNCGDKHIYDSDVFKYSNPICMLKKPVIAYLNTKYTN